MELRTIKRNEIKKVSNLMAECFVHYPLYDVFFQHNRNLNQKKKRIYYFFWFRNWVRQKYTFVTDAIDAAITIKRAGKDEDTGILPLLLNPFFLFGFFLTVPLKSLFLVSEFSKMEKIYQDKYYNEKTDDYLQVVCVKEKSRKVGAFMEIIKKMDEGRSVFLETHEEALARLYKFMGAKEQARAEWHGVSHYVMKRIVSAK